MEGRHLLLESPALGRNVHVWAFGHFGPPVIVFPSAAGFAHEWQRHGMVAALWPQLRAGRFKLYCPESTVSQSWTNKELSLEVRMQNYRAYERFVLETLVPFVRQDCRWREAPIVATGASLGGMYAALFALKYPDTFKRALCFSGRYLATAFTGGENSADVYFNNPLAFVPGLEGEALARVRQTHLTLVCGRGAYEEGCIEETIAMGKLLDSKGIPNMTDVWGRDSRHDWDWWRKQAVLHFQRMFPG
jgi:esterase/lipase superfamily enzyme